jgi:crotonobetainyl-CoA:carnitine CoA-transferase CaiB-like acyl-CoA transferase
MTQPFSGIRILDFTQVLAGPFGVMQLALLGAEVIKIEQPGTGDQTRGLMNADDGDGMAPSFMTCNVNKQSLTLNLKAPEAKEIIERLVGTADVVVENFKAGTMDRLGFGYEDLHSIKPDLIFCAVSGYGQSGPKAGMAAYDGAIQASSGMMSQTGHPETGPTRTGYMPVDMTTALNSALAVSAALYRKRETGEGQFIDVAMMDTAIVAQAAQYSNYMNRGTLVGLNGNRSATNQPTADVFPTRDGFIQVTAIRDPQVAKLFEVLGESDKLIDPAFSTSRGRLENQEMVQSFVAGILQTNTTAHWMRAIGESGVPVAEIRTVPEVIEDEQLKLRGVFESLPSRIDDEKTVTVVKAGYVTNKDGPTIRSGPPLVGEHTEEILANIGYSRHEIEDWRSRGVI